VPRPPASLPPDAVVAIDGPAGSGKSTTARAVARRHGLDYIDTGAMYRALTHAALAAGVAPADGEAVARLLAEADLTVKPGREEATVLWNGRDVSQAIRTPEVEAAVSAASAHAVVRERMVERQRQLGRRGGVVMEGRDIGSVVFPLATAKLYLDATCDARTERRVRQYRQRGLDVDPVAVREDLERRDRLDSEREASPLTIAPDAQVLETSGWSLERQLDEAAAACLLDVRQDAALAPATDPDTAWRLADGRYRLAYSVAGVMARAFGLRLSGLDGRVPPPGCIIACNHISLWDPPLVGSTFRRGRVRAMAKVELFRGPLGRAFFRFMDTIPVQRRGYDARAFREARTTLQGGHCVFLFPEGTRRPPGRPGPVVGGLGLLAVSTAAPILPVFVRGTRSLQFGGNPEAPLEVRYGPLRRLHGLDAIVARAGRKVAAQRVGDLFLAAVGELQARSYAATPLTDAERELNARLATRDRRRRRPFGAADREGSMAP